jgi:hypothetical protein
MNRSGKSMTGLFASQSLLAIALALGMTAGATMVSSPAEAAKKKSSAPKLKLSKEFLKEIAKADKALSKQDIEGAKAALAASEPLIESNDDRFQYHSIAVNIGIAANDNAMTMRGVRGMVDTGLVGEDRLGQFATIAADAAFKNKEYDAALAYAAKAQSVGYQPGQVYPIIAQAHWGLAGRENLSQEPARSHVAEGLANFRKGIEALKAEGQAVPNQWYQVAIAKAEAAGLPEINDWARMAFEAEPSGENLRTILRVFQREHPEMSSRENLDLLRLMYWSGGLVLAPDFTEYAEMAGKSGIYGEVKSVIDDGKQQGVLGSAQGGDYYATATEQIAGDKASLPSAEADAKKAATGKIAAATGDAYLGYENYAKAVEMYNLALQKGSIDADEVNTHIGIALAKSGDSAGAISALNKVQGAIRGPLAKFWIDYIQRQASAAATSEPAPAPAE